MDIYQGLQDIIDDESDLDVVNKMQEIQAEISRLGKRTKKE